MMRAGSEEIQMMRGLGFDVSDHNEPAEENVPSDEGDDGVTEDQAATWEWDGVCQRKARDHHNNNLSLKGVSEFNISTMSYTAM